MKREDRRRQLLRCAIETFSQRGFGGTKTRDIAMAAGVSESILFRHFATKQDLYHAILDAREDTTAIAQCADELQDCADRRDDVALFRLLARRILSSFHKDPAFHRLLLYASLEGHVLASLVRKRFALPMGAFVKRYIALRQKEGAFRKCDPEVAMRFASGCVVHWATNAYLFKMKGYRRDEEALVNELVGLVLGGLAEQ